MSTRSAQGAATPSSWAAETDVIPAGHTIDIELVWDPPWTPERMSPEGKAFMGW